MAIKNDDSLINNIKEYLFGFNKFSNVELGYYNSLFLDFNILGGMHKVIETLILNKNFAIHVEFNKILLLVIKMMRESI